MPTYADAVRASFEADETEHLLTKVKFGGLTVEAHVVALQELSRRGVDCTTLPTLPVGEESSAPAYWKLTAVEHRERRYRLYGLFSISFLVLWALGCGLFAMDLAHKRQVAGMVIGWAALLLTALPPTVLSFRAWKTVAKSESMYRFIGRGPHTFWMLSISGSALSIIFAVLGVAVEALK